MTGWLIQLFDFTDQLIADYKFNGSLEPVEIWNDGSLDSC
jgi:hypothetical protein